MLWWLAQNALLAAVFAGVVALACRYGRFRPAVQHALWLVVLLKLVTPPLVTWPGVALTIEHEIELPPEVEVEQPHTFQFLAPSSHDLIVTFAQPNEPLEVATASVPSCMYLQEELPPEFRTAFVAADPTVGGSRWPTWLGTVALQAILAGAVAMALIQCIRLARFQRQISRGQPAPRSLANEVKRLAARLSVRPPEIRVLPDIASPLVCGLGRPMLLWPEQLIDSLTSQCQRAVIVHELAHLRRRDHWVAWLRTFAGCVWWWNPLYWYVSKQLGRAAELACDAWVVGALPGARRAYAEALVAVAQMVSKTAAPSPALGMSVGRQDFERRLTMIMCERVPYKTPVFGLAIVGLLAAAVLPGLSLGQKPDKPAKIAVPAQPAQQAPAIVEQPVEGVFVTDFDLDGTVDFVIQTAPGNDRERKLKELEDKLQSLLKEVKSLREAKAANQATTKPKITSSNQPAATANPTIRWSTNTTTAQPAAIATPATTGQKATATNQFIFTPTFADNFGWTQAQGQPLTLALTLTGEGAQQHAITLSRVTYKLPKDKADALAAFLPHIKASVLESKAEGDGVVVTTTPEVQQTIGQLVGLMQGKTHGAALNIHKPVTPTTASPAKP